MVVPLGEDRDGRVEGAHVAVAQVVAVRAAELGQRLGDLRLLVAHEVAPPLAVRQRDLGTDRVVRIDRVAAVDEEIRPCFAQGGVGPHAVAVGARAVALPAGVAAPREDDVARVPRRGDELADDRLGGAVAGGVLEGDAVEDALAGGKVAQQELRRVVRLRTSDRADDTARPGERFRGAPLDLHRRGAIGPGPDDGGIRGHVAAHHPMGHPGRGAAQDRGPGRLRADERRSRQDGGARPEQAGGELTSGDGFGHAAKVPPKTGGSQRGATAGRVHGATQFIAGRWRQLCKPEACQPSAGG